jgi:hypothetical protein
MGIPFGWVKLSSAYLFRGSSTRQAFQNIESKSAISLPKHFTNGSRKFYRTVIYEETDSEKVARDVDLPPVRQTDPEQLARQVNLPHFGDNALVPDQKERRDDDVAVWAKRAPDGHGNTLILRELRPRTHGIRIVGYSVSGLHGCQFAVGTSPCPIEGSVEMLFATPRPYPCTDPTGKAAHFKKGVRKISYSKV